MQFNNTRKFQPEGKTNKNVNFTLWKIKNNGIYTRIIKNNAIYCKYYKNLINGGYGYIDVRNAIMPFIIQLIIPLIIKTSICNQW